MKSDYLQMLFKVLTVDFKKKLWILTQTDLKLYSYNNHLCAFIEIKNVIIKRCFFEWKPLSTIRYIKYKLT